MVCIVVPTCKVGTPNSRLKLVPNNPEFICTFGAFVSVSVATPLEYVAFVPFINGAVIGVGGIDAVILNIFPVSSEINILFCQLLQFLLYQKSTLAQEKQQERQTFFLNLLW